jgi:AraC-like DNA-binding protein
MIFESVTELRADQLPYHGRRMFPLEQHFAFAPATAPRLAVRGAEMTGSRLYRVHSTGHEIRLIEPECTSVLIPRRGTIEVRTPHATFAARPGETLLFAPNNRVTTVVPDKSGVYECDCLLVPTAAATDDQPAGRLRAHTTERAFSGSVVGRPDSPLLGILDYLFGQAMLPDTPLSTAGVQNAASILVQELMAELIDRLDDVDATDTLATAREMRLVGSAEDFMRAHLDRPLSVGELAAQLGVSRRRLQYAFQHVRQASPRTILGELRLERARQQLADPADGRTVAQIALECGIAHFGRFAAAYAARYGELPSVTRQRALGR